MGRGRTGGGQDKGEGVGTVHAHMWKVFCPVLGPDKVSPDAHQYLSLNNAKTA